MSNGAAHQIIMASAGTGKTFALTGRLLQVLALGVPFERVMALTFTRAAAGEIMDDLMERLATATATADAARREAERIPALHGAGQERFRHLLRDVISRMHCSGIGTLDSFFVRLVRLFPFEFGLAGEFTLIDGYELALSRHDVLRTILRAGISGEADAARGEFVEAFKRATFGAEEKRLHDLLDGFVRDFHALYLEGAAPSTWGSAERVWSRGSPWWRRCSEQELAAVVAALRRELAGTDRTESQVARWDAFLDLAAGFTERGVITAPGDDILGKVLEARVALAMGQGEIVVQRRRVALSPRQGELLLRLAGHVVACLVESRLEATRGLRDTLARYEEVYDRAVRRSGRLGFADVAHVVTTGVSSDLRLDIDFRIDGAYDHWALDEFQDTSRRQWQGIESLVSEVLQDTSGRRSFFAVGDVKQAIYGWRGGDARLLGEIAARYSLPQRCLSETFRCGPAVVETVNRVFGDLSGTGLPPAAVDRWQSIWAVHRSARPNHGGTAQLRVMPADGEETEGGEGWCRAVAAVLQETMPWRRGLSAAVLVRSNGHGVAVTEHLRNQGVPAVWMGDKAIADNPAVAAVLDLFRLAEHPGDTLARGHLGMTPLGADLGVDAVAALGLEVLATVHASGFARAVEALTIRLGGTLELDAFSRRRLRALLDAAEEFDRTGSRSCLAFAEFVEQYTVKDVSAERTVQVMTIHRSKGLGFDLVVLPVLRGRQGLDGLIRGGVLLGPRLPSGQAEWVLLPPPRDVAAADEVLREAMARASEEACFEELCVLYVAMTRARRGLYLLVPPPPKSSKALHLYSLLRRQLAGEAADPDLPYCVGDPGWHEAFPERAPLTAPAAAPPAAIIPAGGRRPRHARLAPSEQAPAWRLAGELFVPAPTAGRLFGTAVHAVLSRMEWVEEFALAEAVREWQAAHGMAADLAHAVEAAVARALATPDMRRELSRPPGRAALWRERSFEMIHDGRWVSGTFDRVVVHLDGRGRPQAACVQDFKTDRIADDAAFDRMAAHYFGQLRIYRHAVAVLTGLLPAAVDCRLLFTQSGRVAALSDRLPQHPA